MEVSWINTEPVKMMAASEEDDDSMIVGQPTRPKTPEVPEPEPEPELNIYQACLTCLLQGCTAQLHTPPWRLGF